MTGGMEGMGGMGGGGSRPPKAPTGGMALGGKTPAFNPRSLLARVRDAATPKPVTIAMEPPESPMVELDEVAEEKGKYREHMKMARMAGSPAARAMHKKLAMFHKGKMNGMNEKKEMEGPEIPAPSAGGGMSSMGM